MTDSKPIQPDKTLSGKIVLHDECGDSLWDEVLAQQEDPVPSQQHRLDQELLNRILMYRNATSQVWSSALLKPAKYSLAGLKVF